MEFLPIRIKTLRPNFPVAFDLYIKIGQRYVHYIRDSDPMEADRLNGLKKKGVRKLFIKEESETSYLDYLDEGLDQLANDKVAVEDRGELANDAMTTAADNAERSLESEAGYRRMESHFGKVVEFLTTESGAFQSILKSAGCSPDNSQHSANVATLALGIATKLGLDDSKDQLDLGLAALLHDIGKSRLKFDPNIPRSKLTPDQMKKYRQHPLEGCDLLAGKEFITPRVLALIANHEEIGIGQGFPEKKNLFKLSLQQQALNLANDFDRFCMEKGLEPLQAMDSFYEEREKFFNEDHIGMLATLLTAKE